MIFIKESTVDEGKKGEVTNSESILLEQRNSENKLKYQIDYLSQIKVSTDLVIDRKENAAWVALTLYLSGLVFFFYYQPLKRIKRKDLSCPCRILAVLILIIIAITTFAFIHAQYSSIYDIHANKHASNELILRILDSGKPIDSLKTEQIKLYREGLDIRQIYRGRCHPLQILWQFIILDWAKTGHRNLKNQNTQEASIYLIMLIFNAIIIVQIFRVGFFKTNSGSTRTRARGA